MKLTTASEYALIALIDIARNEQGVYIPLSVIVKKRKLPFKYLEQLMHKLCMANILTSSKGQRGGYKLSRPSSKITVAQIIRLFDGPLAPVASVSTYFYKPTVVEREKKLLTLMKDVRDYIADKLEGTTIKDLI